MIQDSIIQEALHRLVAAAHPLKVILFGSHARGEATESSDLDFLVVEASVKNKIREMVRLRRLLRGMGVSADVLVVSQQEMKAWGHLPGTALYWALKEGKILHEAAH